MPLSIHIFGPLSFHIYGTMIALGVLAALFGFKHDRELTKLIPMNKIYTLVALAIVTGVLGGKLLYLAECFESSTTWEEFFSFWNAGFSVLGAFIAIPLSLGWYMYRNHLPIIRSFDRACIYVPLTFAISRLGCFFAGCCHGLSHTGFFSVTYTDPESLAPLFESLHPTQLYSAGLEFLLFVALYTIGQRKLTKTGQLFGAYLVLMSIERFTVDFLRGDRTLISDSFSFSQMIAGGVAMVGFSIFLFATFTHLFSSFSTPRRS